jgi:hypothetical protein
VTDHTKEYEKLSREELEKESERLAQIRTENRERQVVVEGLLTAYRQLDTLNIPIANLATLHRVATLQQESQTKAEKKS